MRVSIITPTYNRAALLSETIDSILGQNYPDLEYIVLDDGSTDDTQAVLERYSDRIQIVRHENMGETATVNKGFSLVSGHIVCVVCSDDPLLPGAIQHVVEVFDKNPGAVVVYPDWIEIDSQGQILSTRPLPEYDIYTMVDSMSWALGPGTFFRNSLIERLGGRDPKLVYCGDMDFWARAALLGPLTHIPKVLATHRTHTGSASVSCKSGAFAREWVDTWESLLNHPSLPAEVAALSAKTRIKVNLQAARFYCGKDYLSAVLFCITGLSLLFRKPPWSVKYLIVANIRWLARYGLTLIVANIRWQKNLRRTTPSVIPGSSQRFAICTRFTPPLWSGQAVVIGRLLKGLPPESYCMVSLPLYSETEEAKDYTSSLPGTRYLLPPERVLSRLPIPLGWQEVWRETGLLYQALQRGINIAVALRDDSADTIVGCSGDLLDLPAAIIAGKLLDRRVVIYFFDDYTEQWWADPLLRIFASRVEKRVVGRADKILVTNEYMQSEIMCRHGKHSAIVRNPCPSGITLDVQELSSVERDEIKLVFTGAVYHLNFDIIRAILCALARLEADTSMGEFVGVRHRLHIYTAQAREQLENQGLVGMNVVIHNHLMPDEVAKVQRNADVLIIPFSFHPEAKGIIRTAATAKLADYLAAGRPILAICPEDSYLAWYLNDRQCGWVVSNEDPKKIAVAIREIITQRASSRMKLQKNALNAALNEFDPDIARAQLTFALGLVSRPKWIRSCIPAPYPGQLKVVQVSATDLVGMQVNGFIIHKWLQEEGHDSKLLVNSKKSDDESVREIGSSLKRKLNPLFVQAEARLDSVAMLPILSHHIDKDPWVRQADVVNLHLIHAAPFFSLMNLPRLSRKKKVILSVHDMFFLTGHCVYSGDCERWKTGCGSCPQLDVPFKISRDTTARNWRLKNWIFNQSSLDIVVGSAWQEERVSQSPFLSRFRRHMIPYGVDLRVFKPGDKNEARRRMGLPENAHVIAFRSAPFHRNFKGTDYIQQALQIVQPSRPTILLTFDEVGGLDNLRNKYQFDELGWVFDDEKIAMALQAADVFLMPSTAEAFGLMAIESMACGTPPIVFDGTALPDTIGGPDCGVIVPQGDAAMLAKAITDCLEHPERMDVYRCNGIRHVSSKHSFEEYAHRYLNLYQKIAKENRR